MISQELIRRFPFFVDLSLAQIDTLAKVADDIYVETGHIFFPAGDDLKKFYVVVEGKVSIVIGVPDRTKEQKLVDHLYNNFTAKDLTVCSVEVGEMFGWSALIHPHKSTAGATAATNSRVLAFDYEKLKSSFDDDYQFAYLMTLKAAQTIRERLRCLRIETLAFVPAMAD